MLSLPIHEHSLSIYLDLWFLTAVGYIFQHISPIHMVLGLHLSVSLFRSKCVIIFLLLVSTVFIVSMQKDNSFLDVYIVSCKLAEFSYFLGIIKNLRNFLCRQLCYLQIELYFFLFKLCAIYFISFANLVALARTSSTVLKNSESRYACSAPDCRGKAF